MMLHASRFTALMLAVILAVTSVSMAVARGQTRIADEIIVCSGQGLITVAVDENGDPAGPAHLCPDMVLAMLAAPVLDAPDLLRPAAGMERIDPPQAPALVGVSRPAPCARGPPRPV